MWVWVKVSFVPVGTFSKTNGGRIYFLVSPYFTGKTGSYALDVKATRVVSSSGIDVSTAAVLKCYPNPASSHVNLELNSSQYINYVITDISGKEMMRFENDNGKQTIDVKGFTPGIYFIRASGETESFTGKFIVTR